MSAFGDSSMDGWGPREGDDVEREVETYLADAARNGSVFAKSARVADDLGISTQRAGQAIALLARDSTVLDVERWSGESTSPVTWRVECTGPTPYGRDCTDCDRIVPEAAESCPHCGRRLRQ